MPSSLADPTAMAAFHDGLAFSQGRKFAAKGSVIVDAGLTEIAAQTTTAYVLA